MVSLSPAEVGGLSLLMEAHGCEAGRKQGHRNHLGTSAAEKERHVSYADSSEQETGPQTGGNKDKDKDSATTQRGVTEN